MRGFLANSVDFNQPADQDSTVYHAANVMLHGLVDIVLTCFNMLKIQVRPISTCFWRKLLSFSKLASLILM